MMGCRAAVPAAARKHRTILADAAAVDDLWGFKSVINVPKAFNPIKLQDQSDGGFSRNERNIAVLGL